MSWPSPTLAAEQSGDLVSDAASAFPDHLGIAKSLPGSDHGLALAPGQDKQGGTAFCDSILLQHSVRDEVPRPKQADGIPHEPAQVRALLRKALKLPHGLAGPPHDRRRSVLAFLTAQASAVAANSATAYSSSAAFTTMRPMAAISSMSSCTMSQPCGRRAAGADTHTRRRRRYVRIWQMVGRPTLATARNRPGRTQVHARYVAGRPKVNRRRVHEGRRKAASPEASGHRTLPIRHGLQRSPGRQDASSLKPR